MSTSATVAEQAAKVRYYQRNREQIIRNSVARTKRITDARKDLLSEFPCLCCGNSNPDLIQWHHVDESTKDHTIFSGGFGEERFWDECLKTIPVCANCHTLIHKNKLCLIPPKLR